MKKIIFISILYLSATGYCSLQEDYSDRLHEILQSSHFSEALDLVENLPLEPNIFQTQKIESGTGVLLPFFNPILDVLISKMADLYEKYEGFLEPKEPSIMDVIRGDLSQDPFVKESLKIVEGLSSKDHYLYDDVLLADVRVYIYLGVIRNAFYLKFNKIIAKMMQNTKELEEHSPSYLFTYFIYLNANTRKTLQAKIFNGFRILIGVDKRAEINLIDYALKLNLYNWLLYLYAALNEAYCPQMQDGNIFHYLTNLTVEDCGAIKLIDYYLYGDLFTKEKIKTLLTQKDKIGKTPLSLACYLNKEQLFEHYKTYLVGECSYYKEEHFAISPELSSFENQVVARCKIKAQEILDYSGEEYPLLDSRYSDACHGCLDLMQEEGILIEQSEFLKQMALIAPWLDIIMKDLKSDVAVKPLSPHKIWWGMFGTYDGLGTLRHYTCFVQRYFGK